MMHVKQADFEEGQRWAFKSNVAEFEDTCVIAEVMEADPDCDVYETEYDIYVKYRPGVLDSLPANVDGVILGATIDVLKRSLTKLLDTNVNLPWWWKFGVRYLSEDEAPDSTSVETVEHQLCDPLSTLYECALLEVARIRRVTEAAERHLEKFKHAKQRPPSTSVAESWTRIRDWLGGHAPDYPCELNDGASDLKISSMEQDFGTLPDDFKESLRIHDGGCFWIPPTHGAFFSLNDMWDSWTMYRELQERDEYGVGDDWIPMDITGPIKAVFWNRKRIYLTDNSGDHLTLDLDPPADGIYGQIIHTSHEVGPTKVLAPSWSAFLAQLVESLETGQYVYLEHEESLTPLEWHLENLK